jgi:prevent-host-death family protein
MPQSRVRFVGSRELHRDLPKVLDALEDTSVRYVLTIHSKPKAVLIGADAFLELLRGHTAEDRLLALQLGALVQGLGSNAPSDDTEEAEDEEELRRGLVAVSA